MMILPSRRQGGALVIGVCLAALAGAIGTRAARAQSYPVYTVTALPLSGFTAFNDRGQILGRAFLPCAGELCAPVESAVLYDTAAGTMVALTGGAGAVPQFDALNALGQLGGTLTRLDAGGALVHSVVLRQPDGTQSMIATPALDPSATASFRLRGLNAAGQMALQSTDGLDAAALLCGPYLGWVGNAAGSWTPLGGAGTLVSLSAINASGRAAGSAVAAAACGGPGSGYRAVASRPDGTLADLHGSMPGAFSRARAINDLGYAVGEFDTGARTLPDAYNPQGVPITHAAVWNTDSMAWFDLGPAGAISRLNAANARGEVVGSATAPVSASLLVTGATTVAVLGNLATTWPLVDLNTLLAQNTGGWVLQQALAINASGQIIAVGTSPAGSGHVLLTPAQPPADPYAVAPSGPANLVAVLSPSPAVRLTWVNTARNATRLMVERCKGNGCSGFVAVATLPGDTSAWLDTTAARRTIYRYRVRAGNAAGGSAPSNAASITTLR